MNYDIVFESDRIYFVKVSQELVNDYLEMINDEEVQKFISRNRRTYTLDGELEWVQKKLDKNALVFSMIEKETKKHNNN